MHQKPKDVTCIPLSPYQVRFQMGAGQSKVVMYDHAWLLVRNHESTTYTEVKELILTLDNRRIAIIGCRDGEMEAKNIPVKNLEILSISPLVKQASRTLLRCNGLDYRPLTD